jgi:hypothetical protein
MKVGREFLPQRRPRSKEGGVGLNRLRMWFGAQGEEEEEGWKREKDLRFASLHSQGDIKSFWTVPRE